MTPTNVCNPFSLGIAKGMNFCNRLKEKEELARHARNGNNVVLMAPRKSGKSSLVEEVLNQVKEEGLIIAYVDLFSVASEHDFIQKFGAALVRDIGKGIDPRTFTEKAKNLFGNVKIGFEITKEGFQRWFLKLDSEEKPEDSLEDILTGLYRYVQKEKAHACIALDEFQEITKLEESKKIEGLLREHMQHHRDISYIYVGSRRRILQAMFNDKKRPFYKSAFNYELRTILKEEFTQYIIDKFANSEKLCTRDAANCIYDLTRGYAYYVQKLSLISWDLTDKVLEADIVNKVAFERLIESEHYDFESIWERLKTRNNRALFRAIAEDPTPSPFSREFLHRHNFSIGGSQSSMKVLLAEDVVEVDEKEIYRVTDPILGAWARK